LRVSFPAAGNYETSEAFIKSHHVFNIVGVGTVQGKPDVGGAFSDFGIKIGGQDNLSDREKAAETWWNESATRRASAAPVSTKRARNPRFDVAAAAAADEEESSDGYDRSGGSSSEDEEGSSSSS